MENEENFDLYLDSRVIIYYRGWDGGGGGQGKKQETS